jgi:hypothetical protein
MTRTNWKSEFQELLDSPALTPKNRSVIEDMYRVYTRTGAMSAGRKQYFFIIRAKTEKAASMDDKKTNTLIARLEAIDQRVFDRTCWDAGFITQVTRLVRDGYFLSERQMEIVGDIESRHDPRAMNKWMQEYFQTFHKSAVVLAGYYESTAYYASFVSRMRRLQKAIAANAPEADLKANVPSRDFISKLMTNKFAKKVLKAHYSVPKYANGSWVSVRSTASWTAKRMLVRGGIVIDSQQQIVSAAAGAKRYRVLPIGSTETLMIEERYLKKHVKPKKKKTTSEEKREEISF